MQILAHAAAGPTLRTYSNKRRALALAMVGALPFFLVAAALRRANPIGARPARSPIFEEARARAAAVIPFIFMG